MPADIEPELVPELLVSDLDSSMKFWVDLCRFEVSYSRPEERFAYVTSGSAHVMLDEIGAGRNWVSGPLQHPLGRGINFQIAVADCTRIAASLDAAGVSLFMSLETKWYRVGVDEEAGVKQFVVADPDGYLLRFQSSLGHRPVDSLRTS
ncbi:bleomycin resistance protein [Rhodococcoides fascians]|uniref:bleomycin resistance protein n=1 Tax=Rhodococcoides fascians TaxID=1828 RepID=UPI000AC4262A|nr:VOC family protein [Rhodococcus fascians]